MARPPVVLSVEDTVERLHDYNARLCRGAVRSLALYEAWAGLNVESQERQALVASPVTKSVGVMWEATQDTLILALIRALDEFGPRARVVDESDKISFPVFRALLDKEGVEDMLVRDAASFFNDFAMKADVSTRVRQAAADLRAVLDGLAEEEPNRVARLRDVRNRHLAHTLNLQAPLPPPIYQNFRTITDNILSLAELTNAIMRPTNVIEWPRGEVLGETGRLVETIAHRFPKRER